MQYMIGYLFGTVNLSVAILLTGNIPEQIVAVGLISVIELAVSKYTE